MVHGHTKRGFSDFIILLILYPTLNLYFVFTLQSFIGTDITFAVRPYFRGPFCSDDIRQSLVVNHITHVISSAQVFFLIFELK
jgi:hypothetical protein